MDRPETLLRRLLIAGVGAADLGAEKLGELLRECEARGESAVTRGRAINEELKHTARQAARPAAAKPDLTAMSDEERRALLRELQTLLGEEK